MAGNDSTISEGSPRPLGPGSSLTSYEILGRLGTGGMGTVWRARDVRLEREVAIKVLPPDLSQDPGRLQRFRREAKTLASLSHPNVAGIFGIDEEDGILFLVLELVPGEDLSDRLARGRLPIDEATEICGHIAEAIEAAHEQGIVHRDLKPANVRILPDGRVKVLDFGLAKLVQPKTSLEAARQADDLEMTKDGMLLGTPPYMSPEQVRAKPVDRRADIWAFGCLLFECLTAKRAFDGPTTGDVLAMILEREPDWSRLPAGTPAHIRTLLRRCLDKHPRTRLQDAGEARVALATGRMPGSAPDLDAAPTAHGSPVRAVLLLLALSLGGLAAALAVYALRPDGAPPNPLAVATAVRLTDDDGTEAHADISPDGLFVAYSSDRNGTFDLWVEEIDGGRPLNLTRGAKEVAFDNIRNLGFGRNGSHIWFHALQAENAKEHGLSVPRTGGTIEPLPFTSPTAHADWTTDGSRVVYQRAVDGDPIYVRGWAEPEGPAITDEPGGFHQHFPVWSFDDQWILVVRGDPNKHDMNLWRMRPDGTGKEQLTEAQLEVGYPTPIDDATVLFLARSRDGSGPWIWSLDLPTRTTRRISVGLEHYTSLAASADGRRIVATVANPRAVLWRVPIPEPGQIAREQDAEPLPGMPSLRALSPQYAGSRLFYESSGGAGEGLWMLQEDRGRPIWSNPQEPLLYHPSVSFDGSLVALVRRKGSRMQLSVLRTDTRAIIRELDPTVDVRGGAAWSPSAEWIAAGGIGSDGQPGLFRFPVNGGPAERIAEGMAIDPAWSPTEDLIVYCSEQVGPFLELVALRGGVRSALADPPIVVPVMLTRTRFLPDGRSLVYLKGRNLWHLELATGQTRQLTDLDAKGTTRSFDVTPDGRGIVFDRIQHNSDVVLFNLPE